MKKSPFLISRELEKQVDIEQLLFLDIVAPAEEMEEGNNEPYEGQYVLTLEGVNLSWFALKVIRDFLVEKNELESAD